jgi:hypothetical protein
MELNLNTIQKIHLRVSRVILSIGLVPFLFMTVFAGGLGLVIFMNTPMMLILLIGLYLKGAYRYIWKVPGNEIKRTLVAVLLLVVLMMFFTIDEYIHQELSGPMMWAIVDRPIDYPSMWFNNWRLWWVCMLAEGSLMYSSMILYIVVVARWIYLRCKKTRNSEN